MNEKTAEPPHSRKTSVDQKPSERFNPIQFPEKIPPAIFSKWVDLLQESLKETTFIEMLKSQDQTAIFSWAAKQCQQLAADFDAAQALKSRKASTPEKVSEKAERFFIDSEYGDNNIWKMLRNGLYGVAIQEVVGAFEKELETSIQVDTPDAVLCIHLPNGKQLKILNPHSPANQKFNRTTYCSLNPYFFQLNPGDYRDPEEWQKIALQKLTEFTHQHPTETIEVNRFIDYFIPESDEDGIHTTVDADKNRFDPTELIHITIKYSLTDRKRLVVKGLAPYRLDDQHTVYFSQNFHPISEHLPDISRAVIDHAFLRYAMAWEEIQAERATTMNTVLNFVGTINRKGRTAIELDGAPDELDTRDTVVGTIIGGFDTGLAEISKLIDLNVVYRQLEKVVADNKTHEFAQDVFSRHDLRQYRMHSHLSEKYESDEIITAIEFFIESVLSGNIRAIKQHPILSEAITEEPLTAGNATTEIVFSKTLDNLCYELLAEDGNEAVAKTVIENIPLRIPLVLAHMHLQLFGQLLEEDSRRVTSGPAPIDHDMEDRLLDYVNRPTVAATGCPAIPGKMIPTAAKIYSKFYNLLSSVTS